MPGTLLWYQSYEMSSIVETRSIAIAESIAYAAIALMLAGLFLAFIGMTRVIRGLSATVREQNRSSITQLSMAIADKRSAITFALVAVVYAFVFALLSSALVFQPGTVFSQVYGVQVPSAVPVVCCGSFGQMPQLVVYLTEQVAIVVNPVNLILLFTVSWLVGLNAAVAHYAYLNRPLLPSTRWLSGLGAALGLFTVCPACSGFLIVSILGLGGGVALTLALSSLQTLFIIVGIPILLVTPILTSRGISSSQSCPIA